MKPLKPVSSRLALVVSTLTVLVAFGAQAGNDYWAGLPGTSATTNWTDGANWTGAQQTYFNEVFFNGVGANANNNTAVNNVLDSTTGVAQVPIWELDYNVTNGNYTTLINPGVTLTVGVGNHGYLTIGADQLNGGTAAPANAMETISITGSGGTLNMAGTNAFLWVSQGSAISGDAHNITFDLSGLDNFVDNYGSAPGGNNFIRVAAGSASSATTNENGTLYLAKTNTISLGNDFQIVNQTGVNSLPCAVYLGMNNSILTGAGNLVVGGPGTGSAGALMEFNPAFVGGGSPPTANFGGNGASGRIANFYVSDANGGPQVAGSALCDFSGGSVTMMVSTMQLGIGGNSGANATGTLTLDNGVVDVNTAYLGSQQVSSGGAAVGIVNLNTNSAAGANGTLRVNNTLNLTSVNGSTTAGTAGTINIKGGSLIAGTIASGGGTSTINCTGGSIAVSGTAGSAGAPISALSLTNSSLTLPENPNATNAFVTSLVTGGSGNVINISSVTTSPSYPVVVRLIRYTGSIGGAGFDFTVGTLPPLAAGFISNDTANSSVDLVLTAGPGALTWNGSVNGNWDSSSANWNGGTGVYSDGDFVQFLDGATANDVNLTTTLLPAGITVSNNALKYTFSGTGNLSGPGGLVKQGTNVLVFDESGSNNYTGGLTISTGAVQIGNGDANGNLPAGSVTDNSAIIFDRSDNITVNNAISGTGGFVHAGGGTLQLSGGNTFSGPVLVTNNSTLQLGNVSALGGGTGAAIIANGSTLDANGFAATKTIMVSGTGMGGNGALTDTGGSPLYGGLATNIILTGDTTFTYPVRWDLGSASPGSVLQTDGQARNLTLSSSAGYFQWDNLSVLPPLANITIAQGTLGVVGATTFGDPNGVLTISPSATLIFYGSSVFMNKQVDFQNGATIAVGGGNNRMAGTMTLEPGFCVFQIGGGTSLSISNVLTGSGVFYQNGGTGSSTLWGNSPSFTGGIQLFTGSMTFNGTIGSGITTVSSTTLAGGGTANGLVDVSGAFNPGGGTLARTFTAGGGLTLEGSAALTMDLGPNTTVGSGSNDLIAVTGDLTVNGNNITINPLTGTLASGTYVLMTYSGNLNGSFGTASTVASSRYSFSIDTSVAHQVRLVVTGVADVLAWNNGSGNSQWDVQSSLNWSNLTTHVEDEFFTSDSVLLDDRGSQGPNPSTSLTIPSGTVVVPSVITNNSTTNYTISGAGKISGVTSIVKLGPSTLTLSTTNDFTGNVTIAGGTVKLNGNVAVGGATNSTLTISNGATLAVSLAGGYPLGDAGFSNRPIVVSGAGANGKGAIQFTSGNPLYSDGNTLGLGQNITLTGDTTFSGANRFDWGYPGAGTTLSTRGSNYNLTASVGSYSQWYDIGIDTNLGNIDLLTSAGSQQTMRIQALGVSLGNPTNVLTLHSNILFNIQHGDTTAGDNGYNKIVHILQGAAWQYQPSGGAGDFRLGTSFVLETNAGLYFFSVNGGSGSGVAIAGTVTLNNVANFQIGNAPVTFSNVISGAGGFYLNQYGGFPLVFAAANTYQGITDIRSGMVLALTGNGSISSSTNISIASGALLDVSGRSDQTLTLASGQTLQGKGAITGNLTVGPGAALALGGVGNIGTLAVTNSVNLAGTTLVDINGASFDQLNCTNGITFGGALVVSNLGAAFTAGQSFKLFNAGSYTGTFSSVTPAPGPGLAWDQSALNTGTIKVIAGATRPTIGHISISGGNVILSGTNNTGPGGTYHVLTSTNIAVPASNWTVLTNGSFDSNGNFSSTNALGTSTHQFYLLQIP